MAVQACNVRDECETRCNFGNLCGFLLARYWDVTLYRALA